MPAIFFVSDHVTAEQFELNHSLPAQDIAEMSSVDTLKLSTLWAVMAESDDDPVELMDRFIDIRSSDDEWTNEVPEELVGRLAAATDSELQSAAMRWIETDEMVGCELAEAVYLLTEVRRIARSAQEAQRPLFLYVSL
ncbi:MAG: hypothetical protein ABL994_15775 [Verrucomicrobiales bacterium]